MFTKCFLEEIQVMKHSTSSLVAYLLELQHRARERREVLVTWRVSLGVLQGGR